MLSLGIDIGGSRVKAALLEDGALVAQVAGSPYERPSFDKLVQPIRETVETLRKHFALDAPIRPDVVGLAVPGALSEDRQRVTYSANLPALIGKDLKFLALVAAGPDVRFCTTTDQIAAATDYAAQYDVAGFRVGRRLLGVSIGTGVGAAVLDFDESNPLGRPLTVNGLSPGHIGQMDVSLSDDPPIGPDGGAGSLEAYLGARALAGRDPASLAIDGPPIRALVRALRICHAIYRPQEIALLGGVGIRLRHLEHALYERISAKLTKLARPDWRLGFGEDDFHAARGAARLAAASPREACA